MTRLTPGLQADARCAPVTRRHLLAGAGACAIRAAWPATACAEAADEGWTVLRAQPPEAGTERPPGLWTFNGAVPGPVLRARRGEEVKVRFLNTLPQDLTLHWHGVRLANAMDGVPYLTQAPVKPGASFDYRFVAPDAGTYWYHPVLDRPGAPPGLSGALIIEESEPTEVDRDLVLILDTWRGREGTAIFVNGQPALDIPVRPNERLRLRVINAARADAIALRLGQHRPVVMAIDGQPAEPFTARDGRVALGPGNRADLFVDLVLPSGATEPITLSTMWGDNPIGRFLYSTQPMRSAALPDPKPLPPNPLPARIDLRNAHRMTLPLAEAPPWIDAKSALSGHQAAPLFSVKRGRAVMLTLTNSAPKNSGIGFAVHLHGHHARLLDNLDDGWKPYWLDTVVVTAGQTARIVFVADNPGKWLIELQSFASHSAVTWFEVT